MKHRLLILGTLGEFVQLALLSETGTALLVQRQISLSGTAFEAGASDAWICESTDSRTE